jgi:4a-hydroxytetrahydrobiopterin dehydratase
MERGPADRFTTDEITAALGSLPGWSQSGDSIERTYVRKNFVDAVDFIRRIADIAESQDHHPDILLHGYKNVKIMLSTHSAGGVTQNDIDLARAIDSIA